MSDQSTKETRRLGVIALLCSCSMSAQNSSTLNQAGTQALANGDFKLSLAAFTKPRYPLGSSYFLLLDYWKAVAVLKYWRQHDPETVKSWLEKAHRRAALPCSRRLLPGADCAGGTEHRGRSRILPPLDFMRC